MTRDHAARLIMMHAAALSEARSLTASAARQGDPDRRDQLHDDAATRTADAEAIAAALAIACPECEQPPAGQLALIGLGS
jgi:hypothetical protein